MCLCVDVETGNIIQIIFDIKLYYNIVIIIYGLKWKWGWTWNII